MARNDRAQRRPARGGGRALQVTRRRGFTTPLLFAAALLLAACGGDYPNTTLEHTTEFNTAIDVLFDKLLFWGTIVFIGVEVALLYVIFRFRRRPAGADPKPVHGNTTLEIIWTAIPAVILLFIAVPTVRTIFQTQAKAAPDALQVEVIGHQWWWEFRYPQYGITTANELYLPKGRTVNFALTTVDVLHSFWIPKLGGKRDLITNKTNYLWFTPDSLRPMEALNGFCAEYCGSSHANMKFRTYTVDAADFERWAAHQARPAVFPAAAPAPAATQSASANGPVGDVAVPTAGATPVALVQDGEAAPPPAPAEGWVFPKDRLPASVIPTTKLPADLAFDDALLAAGDAERGRQTYMRSSCIGCHVIDKIGGPIGPNLTHVGSRHTFAAGLYPTDARHLARWIKNAPLMKPGSLMPTLGKGAIDPKTGKAVTVGGLTDAEIADIVAYLQALK